MKFNLFALLELSALGVEFLSKHTVLCGISAHLAPKRRHPVHRLLQAVHGNTQFHLTQSYLVGLGCFAYTLSPLLERQALEVVAAGGAAAGSFKEALVLKCIQVVRLGWSVLPIQCNGTRVAGVWMIPDRDGILANMYHIKAHMSLLLIRKLERDAMCAVVRTATRATLTHIFIIVGTVF